VIIKIEIDTREPLSDEDKALLRAIGYMDEPQAATAKAEPAAKKVAPAKKAAAKKAATAAPAEDLTPDTEESKVADPPVEEPSEDLKYAASERASELLSSGRRDDVIKALKAVGAPRVSEVPADKIGEFLALLADDAAA
jgi:hypothetical protein